MYTACKSQEIIDQIPLFRNQAVSYEPLNGGLSNQTYKLVCGGKVYVLQYYGKQTEYLKLTRSSEVDVMRSMSDARVAPVVLYTHDSRRGYVFIEYVEEDAKYRERIYFFFAGTEYAHH